MSNFENAIANYNATVRAAYLKNYERNGYTFPYSPIIDEERGTKFTRITISDPSKSVHSFVEIATGDIFMGAGYKKPAKGVRGNIYACNGEGALSPNGHIRYLR